MQGLLLEGRHSGRRAHAARRRAPKARRAEVAWWPWASRRRLSLARVSASTALYDPGPGQQPATRRGVEAHRSALRAEMGSGTHSTGHPLAAMILLLLTGGGRLPASPAGRPHLFVLLRRVLTGLPLSPDEIARSTRSRPRHLLFDQVSTPLLRRDRARFATARLQLLASRNAGRASSLGHGVPLQRESRKNVEGIAYGRL
jgi:hypothetical protein